MSRDRLAAVPATSTAVRVLGDSIGTNVFMLGFALQKGLLPLSLEAVEQAIRLNGVAVNDNLHALSWGRLAAHDEARLKAMMREESTDVPEVAAPRTAEELIAHRVRHLANYQNAAYAKEYSDFVDKVRAAEQQRVPGSTSLTRAVAWSLAKLMSYKDEYEVARLYTSGDFERRLKQQFDGDYKLEFNLSPPLVQPARQGHRQAAQAGFRRLDVLLIQVARATQGTARHRVRCFRLHARSARASGS